MFDRTIIAVSLQQSTSTILAGLVANPNEYRDDDILVKKAFLMAVQVAELIATEAEATIKPAESGGKGE